MSVQIHKRKIRVGGVKKIYTAHQSWQEIDGRKIFFRSNWEHKFAKHLQKLKELNSIQDWEHEPQTFWFNEIKRGVRSYMPDFKITHSDGSHYWVEVKGYMDAKSKTKIRRFKKYYPGEQLVVVDQKWFKEHVWKNA